MTEDIQFCGGEFHDGTFDFSEYQLYVNDEICITLTPDEAVALAIEMINHLIVNGHDFKIVDDPHQDIRYKIEGS